MANVEDYFQNGEVYVWKETFAVAKSKKPIDGAFACIQDQSEITVVVDEARMEKQPYDFLEVNRGWKIITFDMLLPLELVGFIAKVATVLAEEKIDILTFSAYSTEHVLVQEKDLPKAFEKLKSLGCRITEK